MLAYLDMPMLKQSEVFLHVMECFFDQDGDIARPDTADFYLKNIKKTWSKA